MSTTDTSEITFYLTDLQQELLGCTVRELASSAHEMERSLAEDAKGLVTLLLEKIGPTLNLLTTEIWMRPDGNCVNNNDANELVWVAEIVQHPEKGQIYVTSAGALIHAWPCNEHFDRGKAHYHTGHGRSNVDVWHDVSLGEFIHGLLGLLAKGRSTDAKTAEKAGERKALLKELLERYQAV